MLNLINLVLVIPFFELDKFGISYSCVEFDKFGISYSCVELDKFVISYSCNELDKFGNYSCFELDKFGKVIPVLNLIDLVKLFLC